jgi:hypothetical protein
MTHISTPVRSGLSSARHLLPWIAVLLVSATLAYALNAATAGGLSASDHEKGAQVNVSAGATGPAALELTPASLSAVSADLGAVIPTISCAANGGAPTYVRGVDSWIVAESRRSSCAYGAP